jgi:hypothetical protein
MKYDRDQAERTNTGGWRPPKPFGWNLSDSRLNVVMGFNGYQMIPYSWTRIEQGLMGGTIVHYDIVSAYYDLGQFWCVNADAIAMAIGDGLTPREEADRSSSDEEDDSDDADETAGTTADWRRMGFNWSNLDENYKITVSVPGQNEHLYVERTDQRPWIERLIPQVARAPPDRRAVQHPYGGLAGDLCLLIMLIAFSVPRDQVQAALSTCVVATSLGGWRSHTQLPERGCKGLPLSIAFCHKKLTNCREASPWSDRGNLPPAWRPSGYFDCV